MHVVVEGCKEARSDFLHQNCPLADTSPNDDLLHTDSEVEIGAEIAQVVPDKVENRIVVFQVPHCMHILQSKSLLDGNVGAETFDAITVEGTDSLKAIIHGLLEWVQRHANVTTLWVHHTVHTLAIDDESDSDSSAHSHVAEGLLDLVKALGAYKFKHCWHVDIGVEKDTAATFFSIEAETFTELGQDGEVLPGLLRGRRDVAVGGGCLVEADWTESCHAH